MKDDVLLAQKTLFTPNFNNRTTSVAAGGYGIKNNLITLLN
jgi:hypothetical protein